MYKDDTRDDHIETITFLCCYLNEFPKLQPRIVIKSRSYYKIKLINLIIWKPVEWSRSIIMQM